MPNPIKIPLSRGKYALIDAEDAPRVLQFKWWAVPHRNTWYAATNMGPWRERKKVLLHRFIADAPEGVKIDHRNRDGLDCQKHNLRHATNAQNSANRAKSEGTSSQYKGVYLGNKSIKRPWSSRITAAGKTYSLGNFSTEIEAGWAYDVKAKDLCGEFANLNFPEGKPHLVSIIEAGKAVELSMEELTEGLRKNVKHLRKEARVAATAVRDERRRRKAEDLKALFAKCGISGKGNLRAELIMEQIRTA